MKWRCKVPKSEFWPVFNMRGPRHFRARGVSLGFVSLRVHIRQKTALIIATLDARKHFSSCYAGDAHFLIAAGLNVFVLTLDAIINNKLSWLVYPFAVFVECLGHAMTIPQIRADFKR